MSFEGRFLLFAFCLLYSNCLLSLSSAQKQKCVQEFLEWCRKNEYNTKEADASSSVSMHSSYINGVSTRVYCTIDFEGTDCLKNKKPWYHCFPDGTLTYEGKPLTIDSEDDDDVCVAKKLAVDSGNNVKFNKTAFNIQMGKFRNRMSQFQRNMHEQMENVNRRLARISLDSDFSDFNDYV